MIITLFVLQIIYSINEKAAMLSNYEVYQLLQETEIKNKVGQAKIKKPKHLVNLSTICYEVSICKTLQTIYRYIKLIPPWMTCNISSSIATAG